MLHRIKWRNKSLQINISEFEGEKFKPTVRIESRQADRVRRLDWSEYQNNYESSKTNNKKDTISIDTFKSKLNLNKSTNLKNLTSLLNPSKFKMK